MTSVVRSSQHPLRFTNAGKESTLSTVRERYCQLVRLMVDDVWDNGLRFERKGEGKLFDANKHHYDLPVSAPKEFYNSFGFEDLSARLRDAASKQAFGIIKSATDKNKKRVFQLKKMRRNGWKAQKLQRAIARNHKRPSTKNIRMQLSGKFIDIIDVDGEFDQFVRISSLGSYPPVNIPIRHHRQSNALRAKYEQSNAILVGECDIQLCYKAGVANRQSGETVAVDQGVLDLATLSDGQVTKPCVHGHTLSSIQDKLARKKKGSNAFLKAQRHRTNYINYAVNRLNFDNTKEVRLEKVRNLRYGRTSSRKLSHWVYAQIEDKFAARAEEEGFRLTLVPNAFRSQRCSECGWVKKSNRKGKRFVCGSCGYADDADQNASHNLMLDLYEIPYKVIVSKLNRTGFYWNEFGIWQADGSSMESLLPNKATV